MLKTDELLNEAIALPVELRAQLADALLRSLNPAEVEIDELWAAEAERRIDQIDAHQAQLIPGEQVFARLYKRKGS
ncbi:MAG: addiction module protein [Planctomycetota bacterium]|jgi:putative addiction module component (TIGR02574 family)|nr:addiction module protein [Planctomycetota bacterium]